MNIPSLYDGIPVDGKSIYWENGTLKSSSTGGGGLAKVIVKVGLAAYESVDGVVTLPAYPTMPDLSGYVTLNTDQNIKGSKSFSNGKVLIYNSALAPYNGFELQGTSTIAPNMTFHFPGKHANMLFMDYASRLNWDGLAVYAKAFAIENGTANQVLRADGGVETFEYSGQSGQPEWVWGAVSQFDHRVWNPANFNVATSVSSTKIKPTGGGAIDVNTLFEENYIRFYNTITKAGSTNLFPSGNNANGILSFSTHPSLFGHQVGFSSDGDLYHRVLQSNSWVTSWRKILNDSNWHSIIDGRYLPLTGGFMTGQAYFLNGSCISIRNQPTSNATGVFWQNQAGNANLTGIGTHTSGDHIHGMFMGWGISPFSIETSFYVNPNDILYKGNKVWHAGNDGAGSGLDADLLDGLQPSDLSVSNAGYLRVNTIFNPNDHSTDSLKLKAYDCYNIVGTPTTYGNVLEINSGTNHWKPQLWFDAYRGGSIRYRNRGYNDSGFEDWRTLAFVDGSIANSDKLDGLHKESFMRYEGWVNAPGYDANTMAGNTSGFTYCNNAPYNGPIVNIEAGGYNLELNGTYSGASMLAFRTRNGDTSSWNSWEYLARTIDNVASATKLQSARLIYGQNFDGTTNISGALSDVRSITSLINLPIDYVSQQGQYFYTNNNKTTPLLSLTGNVGIGTASPIKTFEVWGSSLFNLSNRNTTTVGSFGAGNCLSLQSSNHEKYGLYGWITGSGDFHWQSGRDDGNSSMYNILFQEYGGNICFGNTAAISKVNVYGAIRATDAVYGGRIFAGFDAGVPNSMSCSDWFRSSGPTGWFNQTYSGGIYMADSDQVRVYNNKVLYNDGFRQWGIGGHHCGIKLYNQDHIGINLATASYTWGIYANTDGNIYIGRRDGDINNTTGSYYLIIGAGTMTYNGSIVLNGGGLITYSSDIRLKEIQGYFKPSLNELAALPIFAHSWRNGTPGVQLSTSAQAVQKIMPWNVFEGSDGYLKMDGTRTALAVSIRLAQLANEYITENERWKSDKDRQIEALQREVKKLKLQLNAA
ncbi:MAG: shufflon system plasmid conjugative transfer pilus tip adhesin PilV [Bacteroides sp.]|uniref:shufflon system plasmid conjugative transfer pilus tip adhesin PilV n=1 Tax=Bacteroides sp. TaxID=29523 RepID=UPI002FCCADE3